MLRIFLLTTGPGASKPFRPAAVAAISRAASAALSDPSASGRPACPHHPPPERESGATGAPACGQDRACSRFQNRGGEQVAVTAGAFAATSNSSQALFFAEGCAGTELFFNGCDSALDRRWIDQWNGFTAATAIYPEVPKVRCNDWVFGMQFAEPDQTQIGEVGHPVGIATSQF